LTGLSSFAGFSSFGPRVDCAGFSTGFAAGGGAACGTAGRASLGAAGLTRGLSAGTVRGCRDEGASAGRAGSAGRGVATDGGCGSSGLGTMRDPEGTEGEAGGGGAAGRAGVEGTIGVAGRAGMEGRDDSIGACCGGRFMKAGRAGAFVTGGAVCGAGVGSAPGGVGLGGRVSPGRVVTRPPEGGGAITLGVDCPGSGGWEPGGRPGLPVAGVPGDGAAPEGTAPGRVRTAVGAGKTSLPETTGCRATTSRGTVGIESRTGRREPNTSRVATVAWSR
jgi:hypothetical protein